MQVTYAIHSYIYLNHHPYQYHCLPNRFRTPPPGWNQQRTRAWLAEYWYRLRNLMLRRRQQGGPQILSKNVSKPTVWKRYIDDIFSLWDISKSDIEQFIEQANSHHPTIKFTAEISETETTFLNTVICKGERFKEQSILDKPTETFQYTHYTSCHPLSVKIGFVKGEALRLLRRLTFQISKHACWLEVTHIIW